MLTTDILAANIQGLTDEQIAGIVTLSQNDENAVIAKKTGEIYGALDADILEVGGIAKNGTEKTYDYAKRVLGELKTLAGEAAGFKTQVETLTKEKTKLEKAIAEGSGDAETQKALKQARADLAAVTASFNELNEKYQQSEQKHAGEILGMQIDSELKGAAAGIKFKAGLPESVTNVLLRQAYDKIKGMNPEFVEADGNKVLVFKGATGEILRNAENKLNPYTAAELLAKELDTMEVLDKGRKQAGAGTQVEDSRSRGGANYDVSGARTQSEAMELLERSLKLQGLAAGSAAYQEALDKAWKDNNIGKLPIR